MPSWTDRGARHATGRWIRFQGGFRRPTFDFDPDDGERAHRTTDLFIDQERRPEADHVPEP
ncbi:hypothetical protein D9753_08435 [Streptomyces dangxiongensis]|uniref:Uncharacterized protein n=1 Tax=Streptomyces dangxiongensis TaxID=1442032 RepID=A0A3G2J9H3_9ACTN|nr:hypothetical protein D9753_08435 [Streptomyces dangxiongensis]